jgi:hypothetical protein
MTDYEPTEIDLYWARSMVNTIEDGGTLHYPSTGCIYKLHQDVKVLVLTNPEILEIPESKEVHERTHIVFDKIGWKVLP